MFCVSMFIEILESKRLSAYYLEKQGKRGNIYRKFWVNFYITLLVLIGREKINKKANPVNWNLETLINLEYKTQQSKLGHLILFLIITGFTIYVIIEFTFNKSLWIILLNNTLSVNLILS
jgi:hypothetical protein